MSKWLDTLFSVRSAIQAEPKENIPFHEPITEEEIGGVMIMYKGFGWGVVYEDGMETVYGWVNPIEAIIYNTAYVTKLTDILQEHTMHYKKEVQKGKIVLVKKVTSVEVIG